MKISKRAAAIAVIVAAIGAGGAGILATTAQTDASAATEVVEPKLTPELARGRRAYDKYCASCHGSNAVGTDKGPPFLHRVYHPGHHSDGAFFLAAQRGARGHHWRFGPMKPVAGVTNQDLEAIVPYIRALQKANGIF